MNLVKDKYCRSNHLLGILQARRKILRARKLPVLGVAANTTLLASSRILPVIAVGR